MDCYAVDEYLVFIHLKAYRVKALRAQRMKALVSTVDQLGFLIIRLRCLGVT